MQNFIVKNINDTTFINKETLIEILQENFKLKNELENLKTDKSLKEFRAEILQQIKSINEKIGDLEYKVDNEIEMGDYDSMSNDEIKRTIKNELVRTKNEIMTSDIIYRLHDCDSYEDFFRDNIQLLRMKCDGIQISLDNMDYNRDDNNCDNNNDGD